MNSWDLIKKYIQKNSPKWTSDKDNLITVVLKKLKKVYAKYISNNKTVPFTADFKIISSSYLWKLRVKMMRNPSFLLINKLLRWLIINK